MPIITDEGARPNRRRHRWLWVFLVLLALPLLLLGATANREVRWMLPGGLLTVRGKHIPGLGAGRLSPFWMARTGVDMRPGREVTYGGRTFITTTEPTRLYSLWLGDWSWRVLWLPRRPKR